MGVDPGGSIEIAIDAHVHIYKVDRAEELLRSSVRNFARVSGVSSRVAALMLTESAGFDAFSQLRDAGSAGNVKLERCAEAELLGATVDGWRLLILAGRQVVSAEGLEVHGLCTTAKPRDGKPLAHVLEELDELGALVALPWAVGKWLGRRRAAVKSVLAGGKSDRLFLSDNSARPNFWHEPLFRRAERIGVKILAGSDPLPLPGAQHRVGSVGCAIHVGLSEATPASDLKAALRDPRRVVRRYGSLETPIRFLANQMRLRLGDIAARA
jgi:hypothetical protein